MFKLYAFAGLAALLPAGAGLAQAVSLGPPTTYTTNPDSNWTNQETVLADVNGDNRLDALVLTLNFVTYASQVAVLLGNGDGTWQAPAFYSSAGQGSKNLAVADLNADGKPDVVVSDQFSAQVSVLLGTGTGAFQPAKPYATGANTNPGTVAVADMNADGKPDVVVAAGPVVVLRGNGDGTLGAATPYANGLDPIADHLVVADMNADGKPDVVTETPSSASAVSVLLGTSTGTLKAPTSYPAGSGGGPNALAVADLNADGHPDVLTASSTGVGVLLGSASGALQLLALYPVANTVGILDVAAADLNADGRPDALTANYGFTATVSLLPGTGTGQLQAAATFPVGAADIQPGRVTTGDLNADGRPDVVVTSQSKNTFSVLLNTTLLPARAALPGGQVRLSPNPAGAAGTILALNGLPATVAQVQATLLDATGRVVARPMLAASQGAARAELPTTGLAPGLYLLRLVACDGQGAAIGALPPQRLLVP